MHRYSLRIFYEFLIFDLNSTPEQSLNEFVMFLVFQDSSCSYVFFFLEQASESDSSETKESEKESQANFRLNEIKSVLDRCQQHHQGNS